MSATSASVLSSLPGSEPYPGPMTLKVEPDAVGAAGGPPHLGHRLESSSSPATASSDDEQRQQQQVQDTLETHVSGQAKAKISRIVEEVESMSDMERLLLLMRLPNTKPSVDASLVGLPGVAGTSNLHLSNQLEQSQAYTWIMSHLEEHASTCLRKDEVYDDYRSYCENHQMKSLNTADFGKVMKRAFPNVKPRRLGQRGQSKYCYGGMRKRVEVQPPYLPDLNPAAQPVSNDGDRASHGSVGAGSRSGSNGGGEGGTIPAGESMLPECIVLVLEWVEKLLGRQFETLRQLAEYLVTNMYVNSRSCAAFSLVADIHSQANLANANGAGRTPASATPRRRTSVGAHEEVHTPGESASGKLLACSFATPPTSRPSPRPPVSRCQTPPGPPITAYSAASVRRRLGSPCQPPVPADASTSYPGAPPLSSYAPPVKPNLLRLPPNLKDAFAASQHTPPSSVAPQPPPPQPPTPAYLSSGQPMRAFPSYFPPGHQPPAAHSQTPFQRYPVLGEAAGAPPVDAYPPPPLQYGGGAYTPVHRGKRPYEATTQEHYSPYYTPNNATYPAGDFTSPKRQRFASMGESSADYGGAYYQQQQQSLVNNNNNNNNFTASSQFANYDPYGYGVGMLSPRASSSSQQHRPPPQQPTQQPTHQQLPRLGCSPGPYGSSQRASPFTEASHGAAKLEAAGPSRVLLPSLPKVCPSRPSSRSQPLPRVGRTPSPVRFSAGPAVGPGLRRPSPLRSSPGQPSSHGSMGTALGSPESGASIHLPGGALRRSPGSPFRSLGGGAAQRKTEAPLPSGSAATAPQGADPVPGSSASHRRSADLHTPTPPTTCAEGAFFYQRTDNDEPSPPSAFL